MKPRRKKSPLVTVPQRGNQFLAAYRYKDHTNWCVVQQYFNDYSDARAAALEYCWHPADEILVLPLPPTLP